MDNTNLDHRADVGCLRDRVPGEMLTAGDAGYDLGRGIHIRIVYHSDAEFLRSMVDGIGSARRMFDA